MVAHPPRISTVAVSATSRRNRTSIPSTCSSTSPAPTTFSELARFHTEHGERRRRPLRAHGRAPGHDDRGVEHGTHVFWSTSSLFTRCRRCRAGVRDRGVLRARAHDPRAHHDQADLLGFADRGHVRPGYTAQDLRISTPTPSAPRHCTSSPTTRGDQRPGRRRRPRIVASVRRKRTVAEPRRRVEPSPHQPFLQVSRGEPARWHCSMGCRLDPSRDTCSESVRFLRDRIFGSARVPRWRVGGGRRRWRCLVLDRSLRPEGGGGGRPRGRATARPASQIDSSR